MHYSAVFVTVGSLLVNFLTGKLIWILLLDYCV